MTPDQDKFERAGAVFQRHGGTMRTAQAIHLGVHPRTLYEMRDAGILDQLGRGVYRLAELPVLSDPDLATVALKIPHGIICLISALAFHEITTQVPHEIYLAVSRGTTRPRLHYPPLRVFWFTDKVFTEGIETHVRDGVPLRVYSPEKTLADCFKYRNKIGIDTVVEALKLYRQSKPVRVDELLRFARVCRVFKVMKPYLEALL
ncbi:MAG: type IV toxin-antitoxin system AbiEi family antitoxin domain-containing protein [Desulfomonile sp.]|nr:type IV toxin-antitoxin system AbiEi family antitoxin domain-containing protein [Desulfomonile sp.]